MVEKAKIQNLATNETYPVMFNPTEYHVSIAAQLAGEGTSLQFKRVSIDDFIVPLFFDTYEQQTDVRNETQNITSLVMPSVEGKKTKQPPVCLFLWGNFSYKGVIYKIDQKFTMFLASGIPVRSDLTLTFKSVITTDEDAKLTEKEACRKLWTVKSGDRLDLIAYSALKDPTQWRKIAELNNIANPLIFPTRDDIGKLLIIPD